MPSSALERAKLKSNAHRKVDMLQSFRKQIEGMGYIMLEPDVRRRKMAKLMKEWIPELESIGVLREELNETIQGIRFCNDIGRCAKMVVDAFFLVRDRASWSRNVEGSSGSTVDHILHAEAALRRTVSERILSRFGRTGVGPEQENFELEDMSGGCFNVEDLADSEEEDWITIGKRVDTSIEEG